MGFIAGFLIALLGAIRYFVVYTDYSQAIIYIYAGVSIMGFAWVYNKIMQLNNTVTAMGDYLADNQEEKNEI